MSQLYPNTPNIGDSVTENTITRVWNGEKWQIVTGAVLSKTVQTTGNIDISAGNWHTISTGELSGLFNVNVSLDNIPSGSSKWTVEFQNSTVKGWQIETASYDNASFSVVAQDTFPYVIFFKPDGTKMYMIGNSSDRVHQYSLSTAWDITTASYDAVSFSVASQDATPRGIFFKPDGTKMYVLGYSSRIVHQYSLSTAWDITTASYDNASFSVVAQDTFPYGIFFKPDGTKMYMVGISSRIVYQYTPSEADIVVTWPSNISWQAATVPEIVTNQTLIIEFYTPDGGTTIYGVEKLNRDNSGD